MNYPYLPEEKVTLFIADTKIPDAAVITPPSIDVLPTAMRRHADLGIVIISSKKAVCPPETYAYYKNALSPYGFEIIKGKTHIESHYPKDSAYNVGIVGKKCFLNKKVCDKLLFDILISEGYEIIEVKQGYTKCSICPIDENSFITGDVSIYKAGKEEKMDVLLISNDNISLPGFSNGFFGGCTGMSSFNELLINGNVDTLPNASDMKNFLTKKNIKIRNLTEGEVKDIGSIIPLMTD
ncbi:MAG: hypothetical protein E7406_00365 [Ruminococcaceae bacterium]|nr:hypothetical protein [Oscillospiraceae bacterium]